MDLVQFAINLKNLRAGKSIFLKCEPEVLDFTQREAKASLHFFTQIGDLNIPLSTETLIPILGILKASIFEDKETSLIAWGIKNLFSFVKFHTRADLEMDCQLLDLKVVEAFQGVKKATPQNFHEAIERVKIAFKDETWSQTKLIYRKVHSPLIKKVIPAIETVGISDSKNRRTLHPYYEIEGQANGRLACHQLYQNCYIPHTISPEEKESYKTRSWGEVFIYFDFKHMEVAMLQWLANDNALGELLATGDDLYCSIFKLISGGECDSDKKRNLCKKFFLPVIYGQSAASLAEELGISISTAEKIVGRISKLFPKSLDWIKEQQYNVNVNHFCYDYFGRKRFFEDKYYRARNFLVQAPAALVCLEKLVQLHDGLVGNAHLACSIHDGYVVYAAKNRTRTIASLGIEILQNDTELCPGLKLKVTCKAGTSLAELKEMPNGTVRNSIDGD